MIAQDEFIQQLEEDLPEEAIAFIQAQMSSVGEEFGVMDVPNVIEHTRVLAIKNKYSSTHNWTKATCDDYTTGGKTEMFWCDKCNLKCSAFEHQQCLSIVSKVTDNLPTYTVHNEYLKHTCNQVLLMEQPELGPHCADCGIPKEAKTPNCKIIDGLF